MVKDKHPSAIVDREMTVPATKGERLRPDLFIVIDDCVQSVDVAVTWDSHGAILKRKCLDKKAKYLVLMSNFPGKRSDVCGLPFVARGMLAGESLGAGARLGLCRADMAFLAARTLVGSLICLNRCMKIVTWACRPNTR